MVLLLSTSLLRSFTGSVLLVEENGEARDQFTFSSGRVVLVTFQ